MYSTMMTAVYRRHCRAHYYHSHRHLLYNMSVIIVIVVVVFVILIITFITVIITITALIHISFVRDAPLSNQIKSNQIKFIYFHLNIHVVVFSAIK